MVAPGMALPLAASLILPEMFCCANKASVLHKQSSTSMPDFGRSIARNWFRLK
jgi:hypothetical protein